MTHYRPIGTETPGAPFARRSALLLFRLVAPVDLGLQHVGRLEHHHPARKDRHLDPCLGIAPHALALGAHDKRAEAGQLDGFPTRSRIADFVQNRLHQLRQLRARQSNLAGKRFPTNRRESRSYRIHGQLCVRHIEPQSIAASARRQPKTTQAADRAAPAAFLPGRFGLYFQVRQAHKTSAKSARLSSAPAIAATALRRPGVLPSIMPHTSLANDVKECRLSASKLEDRPGSLW